MAPAWALALLVASGANDLEREAAQQVTSAFERAGFSTPVADPALTQAARALARTALTNSAAEAADSLTIADAVSEAGSVDPVPRAIVVRASPIGEAIQALGARRDFTEEPATHVGIGAAQDSERGTVVVLLSVRKALLDPFPRRLPAAGGVQALCGQLFGPLLSAEVYVTSPSGAARRIPLTRNDGPRFCASLPFPSEGRYTLEVVGRGPRGPEVAALFFTDVGRATLPAERRRLAEPATVEQARPALLERINTLRTANDAKPVTPDATLDRVAQAYAERMTREHFFSHVAPDGADMRSRLRAAGYSYQAAGENLGLATGPLAAHFGIEHSPGHRRNVLEPAFTHVGIGVTFERIDDRLRAIVVEVFASPVHVSSTPLADAYRAVQDKRQAAGLSLLIRSDTLEKLAQSHVVRALALDTPRAELPDEPLHQRIFEASEDVRSVAVDVFVLDEPGLVESSRSLRDPENDRLGIGAVKGDSPTYGKGKWWVVVIYASTHERPGGSAGGGP
jgi:uncharacterized protein YkwD